MERGLGEGMNVEPDRIARRGGRELPVDGRCAARRPVSAQALVEGAARQPGAGSLLRDHAPREVLDPARGIELAPRIVHEDGDGGKKALRRGAIREDRVTVLD